MTDLTQDARPDSLARRPAGASVIPVCLARQSRASPPSGLARVFGADPLTPDAVTEYNEGVGLQRIAAELRKLGPEWTVLHAVPLGRDRHDLDHLVIGPGGVFTITTRRHAGKPVWVDGDSITVAGVREAHLREAIDDSSTAAARLSYAARRPVQVTPLLVFPDASWVSIRRQPTAVRVLRTKALTRWLRRRPFTLAPDVAAIVSTRAQDARTWGSTPQSNIPVTEYDVRAFLALKRRVDGARAARIAWLATALPVLAAVVYGLVELPHLVG